MSVRYLYTVLASDNFWACFGLLEILASGRNIAILAGGLAFFVAVIFVELKQKYPTIDLTLFKIKQSQQEPRPVSWMPLHSVAARSEVVVSSTGIGYDSPVKKQVSYSFRWTLLIFVLNPISGRLADKYGRQLLGSLGLIFNGSAFIWFFLR